MNTLFIKIMNMSLNAGWLILLVLILRLFLKKAPKWVHCLLWGMVGLRLIMPFSFQSVLSLIPKADPIPSDIEMMWEPAIDSGIGAVDQVINPILEGSFAPKPWASANLLQILMPLFVLFWLIGMLGILLYGLISCLRIRKKCKVSILYNENIYYCDPIAEPFIFGFIKPKIYLPSDMDSTRADYVIAHEKAHIMRGDHWWKPIGFLLLSIYWFNPLLWLSYLLLCRDIECACDEKVVKKMDAGEIKAYSKALLSCALHRTKITACPLAFGEVGIKARVRNVLTYKKPALWILIIALLLTVFAGICFLTNPPQEDRRSKEPLTLQKVIELSKKGESLSLTDFDDFEYIETGSGLYIRRYPIDEMFFFSIGSTGEEDEPIYFYLHSKDEQQAMIDIRYEDAEAFINVHKDNPVVENVSAGWHCCPVGYLEEEYSYMLGVCGVPLDAGADYRKALPVKMIRSDEELVAFMDQASFLDFDHSYYDSSSFYSVKEQYDAAFFKESDLYLVYCTAPTLDHRFSVEHISQSEGILNILIEEQVPEAGDSAMEGWLICINVPKEQTEGAKKVAAYLSSSRLLNRGD